MTDKFEMYPELYGCFVQMDDRFETVHVWSVEVARLNNGKWKPKKITEQQFNIERAYAWNK